MQCINCSKTMEYIDDKNNIYYCETCGLYAADNKFHNPIEAITEENIMDSIELLRKKNYEKIVDKIAHIIPSENIKGLDIGCARGWFIDVASEAGICMDGIEPEPQFYSIAKNKGDHIVQGLFPQDFHINKQYDFIILNDVFEHLPKLTPVLEKCYSLLKDDGFMIINCPDSKGVLFRTSRLVRKVNDSYWRRLWQTEFYSPHLWYFNEYNLDILMKCYGFIFVDSIELQVMSKDGLFKRIISNPSHKVFNMITFFALSLIYPIYHMFHSDILCRFYKKPKDF